MAIGRVSGPMLQANLLRQSSDLAFETNLLYIDVNNSRIGIGTATPGFSLEVVGDAEIGNIELDTNTITTTNTNGNLILNANGNGTIDVSSKKITSVAAPVSGTDAANKNYVDAQVGGSTGNFTFVTNTVSTSGSNENLIIDPNGTGTLVVSATNSMRPPIGTTAQRPGSPTAGDFRYNSTESKLEYYNGSAWTLIEASTSSIITSQTFTGNGVLTAFTLSTTQTTANVFISTNGVVQQPTTAYSVSGTTLTFTQAPANGDIVEVRKINTVSSNTTLSLSDTDGDTLVQVEESGDEDKIRFDVGGSEVGVWDSTGLVTTKPIREFGSFLIQAAAFNATIGSRYGVNTSSAVVTATLPASPSAGDAIFFMDAGGAFATNNLTLARNGNTIMGAASDLTVTVNNDSVGIVYNGSTWRTYG